MVDRRKKTETHEREAERANLTLIGSSISKDKNKKYYQFKNCNHYQDIGVKEVREFRFRCQTCQELKLSQEASEQNLTLIGAGKNAQYRYYQFLNCGHFQELTTGNVRKGGKHIGCKTCKHNDLVKEASAANVSLIGSGRSAHYRKYLINDCGHVTDLKIQSVREKAFKCPHCKDAQFIQEAKAAGLTLIGAASDELEVKSKAENYRLYRCNECDHEENFKLSHVRIKKINCSGCSTEDLKKRADISGWNIIRFNVDGPLHLASCKSAAHERLVRSGQLGKGNLQCSECFDDKLTNNAKEVGLTYLGEANRKLFDANYRLFQCDKCSEELTLRVINVRQDSFICSSCDPDHLDRPSLVYLLRVQHADKTWLKLGYTNNLETRILSYGLSPNCFVIALITLPFDSGREAKKFELALHKNSKKHRLHKIEMQNYHTRNGHNECYPEQLADVLFEQITTKSLVTMLSQQ